MSRIVGPIGPIKAKIMLIGEALGEREEKEGSPFVGQSGKLLDRLLEKSGLVREDIRITNVMQTRPAGNDFKRFYNGSKPSDDLLLGYARLIQEIKTCQPNVIVPLGNEAMKAILGFSGISNWRGSVLQSPLGKVIPTFHPSAILRDWALYPAILEDFKKINKNSLYPEIKQTKRELKINPTFEEVLDAIKEAKQAEFCAFDIETESGQITCIGLSWTSKKAICVPFWFGQSGSIWSQEQEEKIWQELKELLEAETPRKIAHNGMFDVEWIKNLYGISSRLHFDTMLAFHCLYLELPKALDFLVSLYTDHPYYKHKIKTSSMDEYWAYNATDACLTLECAFTIMDELRESRQESFYMDYVHSLVDPLLGMQLRGIRFDIERRKELRSQFKEEIESLEMLLIEQVGHELNPASNKQMTTWLYEELKIPAKYKKRKTTGATTLAADEETLNEIYKENKNAAIATILKIREKQKILSTYLETTLDEDSRMRCSYKISGTETGRLSSSESSRRTGTNLQNIPSGEIKRLFIADEKRIFINADLSQAEARVVAYLSGETRLIRIFEEGGDIHRKNAAVIYGKKEECVTNEERQLAKRVIHASNYGMGPRTFAKTAGISEADAKKLLAQYFATYPRIKLWHTQISVELYKKRYLINPLGRKRYFYNEWGDSVVKEGLAFIPQSTVADIVNQAVVAMHKKGMELLLQVHDSIVLQTPLEYLDENVKITRECLSRPVTINGKIMIIPVDVKVGFNWQDMVAYEEGKIYSPAPVEAVTF